MYKSFAMINQEQKMSLDYKIDQAVHAIRQGLAVSKHRCAIAFSGGKDSAVLWHLIRTHFPQEEYVVIFGNTGVEFPESLAFARKLGADWGGLTLYRRKPEQEGG